MHLVVEDLECIPLMYKYKILFKGLRSTARKNMITLSGVRIA